MKKEKKEERIQLAICNWVRTKYPDAIFSCDLASGMKLPIWVAAQHKRMRSSRGYPDFFLAVPKPEAGYSGLFLELKASDNIYLKDGKTLKKNDHLHEQDAILQKLRYAGYYAEFGCGFHDCIGQIERYMAIK